ncbi:RNA polymerase sigma factor [Crateriforma conspicua]|uniref:RNA polymerase sigma factor n=1 Tax=Crateriforma conspicua TaxID=2527996 RepID=A0A5C6FM34_9PLAN|nr:sigma-70 family RNA polymerase sigma factor [Crateriforma conspicua]TWU62344.1 RNA polymerase sigma factor [Crateriforma conspicua]
MTCEADLVYLKIEKPLLGYCERLCARKHVPDLAPDVANDTFLKLREGKVRFKKPNKLSPLLELLRGPGNKGENDDVVKIYREHADDFWNLIRRVASNSLFSRLRKMSSTTCTLDCSEPAFETPSPVERFIDTEELLKLRCAINNLPDDLRQIIELAVYHDLSQRQIGLVIGKPHSTVGVKFRQARSLIEAELLADSSTPTSTVIHDDPVW